MRSNLGYWPLGSPVQFLSPEFHRTHPDGRPEDLERLLATELPPGVQAEDYSGLLIHRWLSDMTDLSAMERACSQQEVWLGETLNLPRDGSFNALGDRVARIPGRKALPPLTWYSPALKVGYKATVLQAGSHDRELVEEAATWLEAGQLPTGEPLRELGFILPSREQAQAFKEIAGSIGVTQLLYPDDEGLLWNTNPPGRWLT